MLLLRKKNITMIFLLCVTMCANFKIYASDCNKSISNFDLIRDKEGLQNIFKNNWKALTGEDLFCPEYVQGLMHNRKLDKTMPSIGLLDIKVVIENDKLAGFTAYYMETLEKGIVLFLAVENDFRGKGYGKILMQHAMRDLLSKGSRSIGLWVSETNFPAKKIYEGLGFCETCVRKGNVLYLEYCP